MTGKRDVRLTRRGRATVTLAVTIVLGALVAALVVRTPLGTLLGLSAGPPCQITTGEETYEWSAEQAMTATTVAGVGTRIGATVNGVAAAVAGSLYPEPERPLTPDAARGVYRGLPDVATPEKEEVDVAQALLGHDDGALTCTGALTGSVGDREDPNDLGLTPRADEVRFTMRAVYGKQILGGFAPDGVDSGHIEGSAHYEGRALDVFFRPVTAENQRLGWQQAMWAVAHAERLDLATVIFDRRIWTARRSLQGWRDYRHPSGATDNPVLLHEDHVHVDVVEGG
jgi:hypothetical protein